MSSIELKSLFKKISALEKKLDDSEEEKKSAVKAERERCEKICSDNYDATGSTDALICYLAIHRG